jgi:hypothetical protein
MNTSSVNPFFMKILLRLYTKPEAFAGLWLQYREEGGQILSIY